MWFFTADLHLNHSNIIKYCNRPFANPIEIDLIKLAQEKIIPYGDIRISQESTDRMTDSIIDSINSTVSSNDNLVIIGDFCHTLSNERKSKTKELRERINCNNVYLILGNHDDRSVMKDCFTCYDYYVFNVNGQKIVTFHYPCRSWDRNLYGSWMLYGHTHGYFSKEDNGLLSEDEMRYFRLGFSQILSNHNIQRQQPLIDELMNVIQLTKGKKLTLDVGIDNVRQNVNFGVPWSFDEINDYMKAKKNS